MKIKFKIRACGNRDYICFHTGTDIPIFYNIKTDNHFVGEEDAVDNVNLYLENKQIGKLLRKVSKLHFVIKDIREN